MKQFFILLVVSVSLSSGSTRFLLESELRTNITDNGSSTQFLTGYTYDANGNRVQQRVWNSNDSSTAPMSADKFTYNSNGTVSQELLLSGTDTLTIVRYVYTGDTLIAVHTLTKTGNLRFTDSLLYDSLGRNIEEQRISSAGVKTFFHHYTLNAQGKTVADSLFEQDTSAYTATQAVLFTYNTNSTVATEAQWQLSGTSWYCISTAFMSYTAGNLVAVATHDRDGVGTGMTDSLAYTYDGFGNRTKEADYDGTKTLTHSIVYTWLDTQPTSCVLITPREDRHFVLVDQQGHLMANCVSQGRGEISIFDMTGKRLSQIAIDHSGVVSLNGIIGKGSYVAVFTNGISKQVLNFTKYN